MCFAEPRVGELRLNFNDELVARRIFHQNCPFWCKSLAEEAIAADPGRTTRRQGHSMLWILPWSEFIPSGPTRRVQMYFVDAIEGFQLDTSLIAAHPVHLKLRNVDNSRCTHRCLSRKPNDI